MISIFKKDDNTYYAIKSLNPLTDEDNGKLSWLLGMAEKLEVVEITGGFVGPRGIKYLTVLLSLMVKKSQSRFLN